MSSQPSAVRSTLRWQMFSRQVITVVDFLELCHAAAYSHKRRSCRWRGLRLSRRADDPGDALVASCTWAVKPLARPRQDWMHRDASPIGVVRNVELHVSDLAVGDHGLALRRSEPIDERHSEIRLDLRMLRRVHEDGSVLIDAGSSGVAVSRLPCKRNVEAPATLEYSKDSWKSASPRDQQLRLRGPLGELLSF
jgi:hypothetical protein